jgi:hypothetical protein
MKRRSLFLIAIAAATILVGAGLLTVRRSSWLTPKVQAQRYRHPHLPSSEWEPKAGLTTSYAMREGDSLVSVATLRYGHQNYSGVIKLTNHIENETAIAKGTILRLPDISAILTEAGFTKVAPAETEMILCSRAKYERVKGQLSALRRDRPLRERLVVPQNIRQELLEAADDLQDATESLKAKKPRTIRPPTKMIRQLAEAMTLMRELAEGANDGYGYDIDMVQQRYGLGLTYGIIWARAGFN